MVLEYDVEVDEDAKLVNVMKPDSRALIVQLSYTNIEEVFEDDFQALIRDAVRTQCADEAQKETWNVVTRHRNNEPKGGGDAGWAMAPAEEVYAWQDEVKVRGSPQRAGGGRKETRNVDERTGGWTNNEEPNGWSDAGWAMAPAEEVYAWQDEVKARISPHTSDACTSVDAFPAGESHGVLEQTMDGLDDKGFWDAAPTSPGNGGFFAEFWDENIEEWLRDRGNVALVRGEVDMIPGIGRLLVLANTRRLQEVQEMYVEGRLSLLYRKMCEQLAIKSELSKFETRLKEIIDRLYYEQEEERQLESGGCGDDRDVVLVSERGGTGNVQMLEEDFELALRLQEEEDQAVKRSNQGRASGTWKPSSFLSGAQGQRPVAVDQAVEFPSIPPPTRSESLPAARTRSNRRGGVPQERPVKAGIGPGKLHTSDENDFSGLTKLSGMRGLLVDHLKYSERQEVLDQTDRTLESAASRGISMDQMKAMMAKSAKDTAKLSHCERLLRDGPSRDTFSRKSMEKLKGDMLAVGWVNIRHASHLVYRREMPVPACCGRHAPLVQKTVIACTPSSPHAISKVFHAVYKAEVELYEQLLAMQQAEQEAAVSR